MADSILASCSPLRHQLREEARIEAEEEEEESYKWRISEHQTLRENWRKQCIYIEGVGMSGAVQ